MSGRYLLDTNIIIALFAREQAVLDRLSAADAAFVPVVALGELYYGAGKSVRVEENLNRIDGFAASATLLDCNRVTAQRYGEIKNDLRAKGHPIPENDICIGAVAIQHDLVVATRDDDHFSRIPGLSLEVW
jgi:tRNA(fMet)-specific endonuclease VapC